MSHWDESANTSKRIYTVCESYADDFVVVQSRLVNLRDFFSAIYINRTGVCLRAMRGLLIILFCSIYLHLTYLGIQSDGVLSTSHAANNFMGTGLFTLDRRSSLVGFSVNIFDIVAAFEFVAQPARYSFTCSLVHYIQLLLCAIVWSFVLCTVHCNC